MSYRSGQSGTVVRKGQMWHGRYYVDIPGVEKRRRSSVPLGSVTTMNKTEAKRKLRVILQQKGLNDDTHLERVDLEASVKTFASEAEWWKENRLSMFRPSCQETMGSHLNKYLLPGLGSVPMTAINERLVQEFIAQLSRKEYLWPNGLSKQLSPKTVRNIIGVLRQIVGKKIASDWDLRLPEVPVKEQRYFSADEMRQVVGAAEGQWKALFATLAGTGMRCGEAFGLHVEDVDFSLGRIAVRRSVRNGKDGAVKTKRGYRVVQIEPALIQILQEHLRDRSSGRLFVTRNGTPFCRGNVRRKLNEILKALKLPAAGLHAFRHGRISVLQTNGVPGDLVKDWVGHSSLRTTSAYTHFDDDFRQRTASAVALFTEGVQQGKPAEKPPLGPNGPNLSTFAASAGEL